MDRVKLILGDITKLKVDAIVNAANKTLLGGGGVDGAIHSVAGPQLLAECKTLDGCNTGEAKITKGYKLPAKYVIHTVGPVYGQEGGNEARLLANCYINSLDLAKSRGLKTIAFPAISAGVYGYPMEEQSKTVTQTLKHYLKNDVWFEEIDLVLHSQAMFEIYNKYYGEN